VVQSIISPAQQNRLPRLRPVTMADEILKELIKLETLSKPSSSSSSSKSKSKSKPLGTTLTSLEDALELAEQQIKDGIDIEDVLKNLINDTEAKKTDVDKGLKDWYGGLSKVGKAIDKVRQSRLGRAIRSGF
jgi:hypothetical protein